MVLKIGINGAWPAAEPRPGPALMRTHTHTPAWRPRLERARSRSRDAENMRPKFWWTMVRES